jgi:hypothetical protein
MGQKKRHRSGPESERKRKPAADLGVIGDWYSNTAQREQEEQEEHPKAFEPGEGIEEVLGD